MSARELYEWEAFENVFGPITLHERMDHAGAMAAWGSMVAVRGEEAGQYTDFVVNWMPPKRQTPEEMVDYIRSIQRKEFRV